MTSTLTVRALPSSLDPHVLLARRRVVLLRLVDGAAQRQHQPGPRHLQQVEARLAGGRLEIRAGRTAELQDLQVGVDEHGRRGELIDRHAVGLALGAELAAEAFGRSSVVGWLPKRSPDLSRAAGDGSPAVLLAGR